MVAHDQLAQQVGVEVGLADRVDDRGRVQAKVQEDAQVAELQVRIEQRRSPPQLAPHGDGGVDGDGGGAHPPLAP